MVKASTTPSIIIVCGPTGIGKTAAAIDIAEEFNGEIISADSMQIYRFMDIGTAKPGADEQSRVRHHMIDIVDPDEDFDAVRYVSKARPLAFELNRRGVLPVVAGGTGMYIKALIHGLFPSRPPDPQIRQNLREEADVLGPDVLHRRLTRIDPQSAARIHPNDVFRIIRALETYAITGRTISAHHGAHGFSESPFRTFKIGLHVERDQIYDRINRRVDQMIAGGLLEEVEALLIGGYHQDLKSMQSIGYRQMVAYLKGRLDWVEAVRIIKRDTRRYAKRQLTWFKADAEIVWIDPGRLNGVYPQIESFLNGGDISR